MKKITKELFKSLVCVVLMATLIVSMIPMASAASIYLPRYNGNSGSIVTALNCVGVQSSYSYRAKIAAANGISNYSGTASQNIQMLNLLKKGTLKSPEAATTSTSSSSANNKQQTSTYTTTINQYLPRYSGNSGSIVTALNCVGVQSSYSYRAKIAAANGISNYSGTASQNIQMLDLLKKGTLKSPEEATVSYFTTITANTLSGVTTYSSSVFSASAKLIEVKKDDAPLRKSYSKNAKAVYECEEGSVLQIVDQIYNSYNNLWYKVKYNNKTYWIYSGNVTSHECDYETLNYGDINFAFCDCGKITGQATTGSTVYGVKYTAESYSVQNTSSFVGALPATSAIPVKEIVQVALTAALGVVDGPLPFGELLATTLIATTCSTIYYGTVPAKEEALDIADEFAHVSAKTMDKAYKAGKQYTLVLRRSGLNLKCIGKNIDAFVAFIALRDGKDVYSETYTLACILGLLNQDPDSKYVRYFNDKAHYKSVGDFAYPHIHLGVIYGNTRDYDSHGHGFYGVNKKGERPEGWIKFSSAV